jgi:hypothetical protein
MVQIFTGLKTTEKILTIIHYHHRPLITIKVISLLGQLNYSILTISYIV